MASNAMASSGVTGTFNFSISDNLYKFVDSQRSLACLKGLCRLFDQAALCDVSLVVHGQQFPCHRVVLAAASGYFHTMFTSNFLERTSSTVVMNEIDAHCIKAVLAYLYRGEVFINSENVQQLFNTAHMLQIQPMEDLCCKYMSTHVTEANCIGVYFFAVAYNRPQLLTAAKSVICRNVNKVTRGTEFLQLSAEHASQILSFTALQCYTEVDVYVAGMQWLEHHMASRRQHVFTIMKSVRFALLDENFFRQRVKNKPLFKSSPQLSALFEQVIYFMNHPNRWHELELVTEPRIGSCQNYRRPIVYTCQFVNDNYKSLETFDCAVMEKYFYQFSPWPPGLLNPVLATSAGCSDLYLAGGTGTPSKAVYRIKDKLHFTKIASMHNGRSLFSFVHIDRFLYAIGGIHKGNNLDSVEKYNPDRNQWSKVANLPYRLRCTCAVSYRGRVFVFGGEVQIKKGGKREFSDRTFCYDPETDKWRSLKAMSTPRGLAGCALYKGKVIVVGGMRNCTQEWIKNEVPSQCLSSTEEYNIAADTWSHGPHLPWPLCAAGVIKYYSTIYVIGGFHNEGSSHKVMFLKDSQWTCLDVSLSPSLNLSIYSCYTPVNLRTSQDWTSDTESESTFEMSSFNELGLRHDESSSSDSDGEDRNARWSDTSTSDSSHEQMNHQL